jgi:hypothetical protein
MKESSSSSIETERLFYNEIVYVRKSQRAANVEYYRRNRGLEWSRIRIRQAGAIEMLRDLRRVPCADCGGRFEPHQMDFDHRDPSTKLFI